MTKTRRRTMSALPVRLLGIERFEGYVLVRHEILRHFEREAARCSGRSEQGGILIGQYRGPHIELTDYTTPGPSDQSSATSFVKVDPVHQNAAERAWRLSGRTKTYLGEWHTHPSGGAVPSFTDRRTWSSVAKRAGTFCVFAVIAPNDWSLYVTEKKLSWTSTELHPVFDGDTGKVFSAI